MSKLLIIDTYGLIFRAYHAYPILTTSDGRPTNAIFGFLQMLLGSIEKFAPDYIACALESETATFRHQADPTYKANRKQPDQELKIQISEIIKIISQLNIHTLQKDGYEADDVIGSFVTANQENFDVIQIITGDKDLLQLISDKIKIFIPGKSFSDLIEYDRIKFRDKFGIDVEDFVLYKALTGDTSDNIKGIPGIGPKSASKIVNQFHSIDSIIANLDMLPPAIAQSLTENHTQLRHYYNLCQIKKDLDCPAPLEKLHVKRINAHVLRNILSEYEFNSLGKKVAKFIDNLEKKYGVFGMFEGSEYHPDKKYELEYSIVDQINLLKEAYLIDLASSTLLGDGKNFVEVKDIDLYNFVVLRGIKKFIGFNTKKFIKKLLTAGIQQIDAFEFVDLKLAWYLIRSSTPFESLNELCGHIKTCSYPELYEITIRKIVQDGLDSLFEMEKKIQTILAHMEFDGIRCDANYLRQLEQSYSKKIHEIKQKIFEYVGHEFNPASTRELGHVLFDVLKLPVIKKNKTGYSTDDGTLKKLEGLSDIIPMIREFRLYSKVLSTYVVGLMDSITDDNKIHTTFVQDKVATGRLSSIDPNLQNLPSDEFIGHQIKKAFKVQKGVFLSIDYSQIDLRILAYESQDKGLREAFEKDEDIHYSTAKTILEKEEISKEERNFAKTINFGIVYGMESYGLSQTLGIDQHSAQKFIEKYFEKFTGVKKYFDHIRKQLDEFGYVNTFLGRRRYFDGWKTSSGPAKRALFREAINMPIQGGSSEIIKMAMIKIFDIIQKAKLKTKLLLQIHDELIFWIEDEKFVEEYRSLFCQIMENVYPLGVPLKVSWKIGKDLSFEENEI